MTEEKKETIYEALANVQKEMPVIGRNKTADVGKFSYSYADLDKIWETARPIIEKHGFVVFHTGEGKEVKTTAYHIPSKELLSSRIEISQVDAQKKGGEVTYYRRYNICMIFNIIVADEDKDAVKTDVSEVENVSVIEEQLELLNTEEELKKYYEQLGKPKSKEIITLFKTRKLQIIYTYE